MNLHLICDKKFAHAQIEVFERYYPGDSLYVMTQGHEMNGLEKYNVILMDKISLSSLSNITKMCENRIENVFVYNANDKHRVLSLYLKKKYNSRIFWMFFGSDLYNMLYYRYGYKLVDGEKCFGQKVLDLLRLLKHYPTFNLFVSNVDFFCFWNIYDYKLLKDYYNTQAKFKFYTHGEGVSSNSMRRYCNNSKIPFLIQINHSASWDGNHLTILKRLAEIDKGRQLRLLIPMSYGEKKIIEEVENFSIKNNLNVEILKEFIPKDKYFQRLDSVNSAIFGHHRQEGGANMLQAFKSGTKVFLREDNNLFKLFKDWGIIVFSFEKDLNTIEDLINPLPLKDQINNSEAISNQLSKERVAESMKVFLK